MKIDGMLGGSFDSIDRIILRLASGAVSRASGVSASHSFLCTSGARVA
jgi:hypothetical protein